MNVDYVHPSLHVSLWLMYINYFFCDVHQLNDGQSTSITVGMKSDGDL